MWSCWSLKVPNEKKKKDLLRNVAKKTPSPFAGSHSHHWQGSLCNYSKVKTTANPVIWVGGWWCVCVTSYFYTHTAPNPADHNSLLISLCRTQFWVKWEIKWGANTEKWKRNGGLTEKTRAVKLKEKGNEKGKQRNENTWLWRLNNGSDHYASLSMRGEREITPPIYNSYPQLPLIKWHEWGQPGEWCRHNYM